MLVVNKEDRISIITPELSKKVGWEISGSIPYPKLASVVTATDEQILRWYRFLPTPENWIQEKTVRYISGRVSGKYVRYKDYNLKKTMIDQSKQR